MCVAKERLARWAWAAISLAAAAVGSHHMALAAERAGAYAVAGAVPLGAPDRWDYVVWDGAAGRVFVAHGDKMAVIDGQTGKLVGQVEGITGGTHGAAISTATGQGFTDDGRAGTAVAFDLASLKVIKSIPADLDADAIASDKASGHIFIIQGDRGSITVVDPKTDGVAATIKVGEKLEYAVGDDRGSVYIAGEANRDLIKVDTGLNAVVARWPTPDCASPHGLAYDAVGRRLFMGCANAKLMVVDAGSGALIAELPIGCGSDAIAFDPKRKRVFSSNGLDGSISVFQQTSPDSYVALAPVTTAISGRTMAVDPRSGRLFVAAADTDPPTTPGARAHVRPGTLRVIILDPAS